MKHAMKTTMCLQLKRFRVMSFRSIKDTGWIDVDRVTSLVGTNESGKTNILVALWKLNPAGVDGAIDLLADIPRKLFSTLRDSKTKPVFIKAEFLLPEKLRRELAGVTGSPIEDFETACVSRRLDGKFLIGFPAADIPRAVGENKLLKLIDEARTLVADVDTELKGEIGLRKEIELALSTMAESVVDEEGTVFTADKVKRLRSKLEAVSLADRPKTGKLRGAAQETLDKLDSVISRLEAPRPSSNQEALDLVHGKLPRFVYYSHYGNLDSEIYLPHVIQNFDRSDLGSRAAAKSRTLRVLFDFVRLKPEEILELGTETFQRHGLELAQEEVQEDAERKKKREILLSSASSQLTRCFREWWRQGDHVFRFQADGNHFRIWVSDDRRPEQIELEGRSAGLQWFLSFYLVFLVEMEQSHDGAILLLDEPGHSLHPLAQEDLVEFFGSLAGEHPVIYTTHSPFLVDSENIDRSRAVYVDDDGYTCSSSDLRSGSRRSNEHQSIYPVFAALGLSASRPLFQGCQIVIVEGVSDQYYLTTIKTLLISSGRFTPPKEVLFLPARGVKGVKAISSMLLARNDELPFVLVDSDTQGANFAKSLKKDLYAGAIERVIEFGEVTGKAGSEVEDLWPIDLIAAMVDRLLSVDLDDVFSSNVEAEKPIVPQIELFASQRAQSLESPGWKVELAKLVKSRLASQAVVRDQISAQVWDVWGTLFKRLIVER